MIDIILYSASGSASFVLDMDEDKSASNPSLEIVHGEYNRVRHFMPRENLITLRDLLNEKLPCDPVKLEPVTIAPQTFNGL